MIASTNESTHMREAIAAARQGIDAREAPFGAAIVRDKQLICVAQNTVWRDGDPTAHAEINALRQAARQLGTIALHGCEMFTTCEPCPMCLAAIHWAKLERVVYGANIADAAAAGFSELKVSARDLVAQSGSSLRVEGGLLVDECRELFERWRRTPGHRAY